MTLGDCHPECGKDISHVAQWVCRPTMPAHTAAAAAAAAGFAAIMSAALLKY